MPKNQSKDYLCIESTKQQGQLTAFERQILHIFSARTGVITHQDKFKLSNKGKTTKRKENTHTNNNELTQQLRNKEI